MLAGLLDEDVAFVEGYDRGGVRRPHRGAARALEHWVDEAAERFGEFSIGAYGFVMELRLDDEVELGLGVRRRVDAGRGGAVLAGGGAGARWSGPRRRLRRSRRTRRRSRRRASSRGPRRGVRPGVRRPGGVGAVPRERRAALRGRGRRRRTGVHVLVPEPEAPVQARAGAVAAARGGAVGGRAAGAGDRVAGGAGAPAGAGARRAGARPRGGGASAPPSARRAWPAASRTCGCGCATPCAAGSARRGCAAGRSGTAFAARMVDAQAPGAASRLRSLGNVAAGRPDGWPERLLSGMGMLHLLCEAYAERRTGRCATRCGRCSAGTRRARRCWRAARGGRVGGARAGGDRAGAPARAAHVAVGARRRSAPALLLDFAPPGAPLTPRPPAGTSFEAGLAFYPGATPLRALLEAPGGVEDAPGFFGRRRRRGGAGGERGGGGAEPVARRVAGRVVARGRRRGRGERRGRLAAVARVRCARAGACRR